MSRFEERRRLEEQRAQRAREAREKAEAQRKEAKASTAGKFMRIKSDGKEHSLVFVSSPKEIRQVWVDRDGKRRPEVFDETDPLHLELEQSDDWKDKPRNIVKLEVYSLEADRIQELELSSWLYYRDVDPVVHKKGMGWIYEVKKTGTKTDTKLVCIPDEPVDRALDHEGGALAEKLDAALEAWDAENDAPF